MKLKSFRKSLLCREQVYGSTAWFKNGLRVLKYFLCHNQDSNTIHHTECPYLLFNNVHLFCFTSLSNLVFIIGGISYVPTLGLCCRV